MQIKQGRNRAWSPYLAGALSGVVLAMSVLVAGKYFGASTSFVRSTGMLQKFFSPGRVDQLEYFVRYVPQVDWQLMFVIGIFFGSLVSALQSGSFKLQAVPDMWSSRFGGNPVKRGGIAFVRNR